MLRKLLFIFLICLPLIGGTQEYQNIAKQIDWEELKYDIRYLSSLSSRVPGYPGNREAEKYIIKRLESLGYKVKKEKIEVTIPVDKGGRIILENGESFSLYSLWPNLVRTSTLPPEGIKGELIYAGDGDYKTIRGKKIEGAVVLMDFNCGNRWINMAMLGARVIIFLEPEDTSRIEAEKKFLSQPLNIPRYWINKKDGEKLLNILKKGKVYVRVKGRMDWEKVTAYNLVTEIKGRDKTLSRERIILSTFYDSISVVPALAPGATSAINTAFLLHLAKIFKQTPPSRTIMFLFTNAHYENLTGMQYFVERHLRTHRNVRPKLAEPLDVKLLISFDLSYGSDEVAVWHGTKEFYYQRYFAPLGKKLEEYSQKIAPSLGYNPEDTFSNGISPVKGINWSTMVLEDMLVEGVPAVYAGNPAINFVTIYDSRRYLDTPLDTWERIPEKNIRKQISFLTSMVVEALEDKEFLPTFRVELKDWLYTLKARLVTFNPRTSFVPSDPVPGAIARLNLETQKRLYVGVRGEYLSLTDKDGYAIFYFLHRYQRGNKYLEGYLIDQENGDIIMAPDLGVNGNENYPLQFRLTAPFNQHMIVLFPCEAINIFDLIDPAYLITLEGLDVFDRANSIPYSYGHTKFVVPIWYWTSWSEPYAVVFAQPESWIKVLGTSGPLGKRYLLLNSLSFEKKELAEGTGFKTGGLLSIIRAPYQAARDMIYLDEFRIKNLKRYGISNSRLENLHKKAWEYFKQAEIALKEKLWDRFIKFSRRALAIESRAYPDVKATSNDVIKGIIFYLAILLPFAYFAERLFFGFPDIRKQIGGVFGIFLIIYWIMRLVHPAFKLANAPEVILLSFILLSLSVIVISIISGKFEEQMQKMKRERAKVHEVDVGRISATAAAFSLGVSNMKRRKVRTWLTSVTLILLTFTVLSFTSVKTFLKFNKILRPNTPLYQGILIRDRVWNPIEETAMEYIQNEFQGEGILAPRSWLISPKIENPTFIKIKGENKSAYISGLVGMSPEEDKVTRIGKFLIAGRWFKKGDYRSVILPLSIAKLLGISPKDVGKAHLNLLGNKVTLIGILDDEKMKNFLDLDDERLTPVNFSMLGTKELEKVKEERRVRGGAGGKQMLESFVHSEYSEVAFLPYEFVLDNGGTIASAAVVFPGIENLSQKVEDFVSRLGITIFVGEGDKVWVYSSVGLTSYRGMGNLAIPIILASLIVLNTMLGSVYERIKEIGTYSSVGLAPVHIAALFMAEAAVYAILGAVAGYLLGQVVAKLATTFGFLKGLTLNYSSLSTVTSTLIVMAVVMLSTIYPARKAAQLSVPDVTRRWELPEPKGDLWEFDFPFTISGKEILGLYIFFRNYFSSYTEESVGTFFTTGVKFGTFEWKGEKGYTIEMLVHLAPFDLGVSQYVTLKAVPTGEFGIYLIQVTLERKSGEISAWKRVNRRFLDTLRKQFLVWRTLSPRVKEEYHQEGLELIKQGE